MSRKTDHPSAERLGAFALGQLPLNDAKEVEEHVSVCDRCCETMMNLADDDTFVELLHRVGSTQPEIDSDGADTIPAPLKHHPRYQLEEIVGRGGMGRVFKARHRMMDRAVALKVIHSEWVRKQEAIDRFRREVKTAASLDHPNIVTAHDAEQAGDLHLLVMEYVDGVDLAKTVQKNGRLPVEQACDYVRQAALGLQYAHDRGMVHRDIKPHNLMVTSDNVVKILDFGLASLAPQTSPDESNSEDAEGNLTIAGSIMGTPDFISPEQAADARKVDGRSDIYSLGMTLYFLLAGRRPFETGSALDKLKLHAEAEPTPLGELRDDVPAELQAIVAQMTAKDPGERFQSPKDVANALKLFIQEPNQEPIAPASPSTRNAGPSGRWRAALFGIIGLLALATLVSVVGILSGLVNKNHAASDEVHGPLGELDSYVHSMMASPHDLVFLNLSRIGPDRNYLGFKPIKGGVNVRFPAFNNYVDGNRQGKYVEQFKQAAEAASLTVTEESEVDENSGSIRGVNYSIDVTGDPNSVAQTFAKIVTRTFSVTATESCKYGYQNLPSEASGKSGEGPRRVSGDEFVAEHSKGERVYFGEVNNWIYLIPRDRRNEKKMQRDADVWYTSINELPGGFAPRIRVGTTVAKATLK